MTFCNLEISMKTAGRDSEMKIFVFTIVIVLFYMVLEVKATQSVNTPQQCCFKFTTKQLPKNIIERFEVTNKQCPLAGVTFYTKKGYQICAKQHDEWVKKLTEPNKKE
ncbi:C-C motif chemokine 3-like [Polypterus senegalus]|uniref:C-C motif chemokine 3-like n=1 Tax=Polypterus senegalus TaxID=55291 RepID=UPI0019668633|nr:C-C motif chemokine 3-like [Polypterus senegalus]